MITFPPAKINLGLNVIERRADGYHNIETVFYPLPLTDALEIHEMSTTFPLDSPCSLKVTGTDQLCEERANLVYKAYSLIAQDYKLPRIYAHLHKSIPSQAGMGGGSSDAAYMIRLLNEQFSLGMKTDKMCAYAAHLGADCAFFITTDINYPRPYYATGIGDKLQPFTEPWNVLEGKYLLLVKPPIAVSTKEAYAGITPHHPIVNCKDVLNMPIHQWRDNLINDFEETVFTIHPQLASIKASLYADGALYAAMSGSGSTLYGIFDTEPDTASYRQEDYYCKTIHIPFTKE
ncbi:MAG: 4-(cytidine 5'-diphospho)-2-C-methyl-D-erythritol kinase [Prevotella sp.]|nr:4-(cytidine 5'-diphospho)-2-C-methyl-D-erythritol kinase [Prevotella sp.]